MGNGICWSVEGVSGNDSCLWNGRLCQDRGCASARAGAIQKGPAIKSSQSYPRHTKMRVCLEIVYEPNR